MNCNCPEQSLLGRRQFLTGLAGLGASALLPAATQAQGPVPRIDVHQHPSPPEFIAAEGPRNNNVVGRSWTPARALEQMDQGGVTRTITSITGPGMESPPPVAAKLARICNDYCAKLNADYPARFGMFVNLPLPHIAESLKELEYGMDVLKADGAAVVTSYGNKWLGDPMFDPLWEELNRRKALVFVHPSWPQCCANLVPGIGDAAIEYGTDTTRSIARYTFGGAAARYPDVRMIWSHGGGTMPFLVDRFINMGRTKQYAAQFPQGVLPTLQRYYYDTAQVPNRPALLALKATVPVSNILFGTDFPFLTSEHHVSGIRKADVFTPEELRAIDSGNYLRLVQKGLS